MTRNTYTGRNRRIHTDERNEVGKDIHETLCEIPPHEAKTDDYYENPRRFHSVIHRRRMENHRTSLS